MQHEKGIWQMADGYRKIYAKEMKSMNPFVVYAMVVAVIAVGYLFMTYLDHKGKGKDSVVSD